MRVLVGGLVGLVLATVADAFLGVALKHNAYLAMIAGGLIAGFVMRKLAAGAGSPYAKGGLAAVVAGVAAVAGPLLATQWYQAQSQAIPDPPASTRAAADDTDEGDASEAPVVAVAEPVEIPQASNQSAFRATGGASNLAGLDIACMVIGCLVAYQLGKGATVPVVADAEAEGDEPAAEAVAEPAVESDATDSTPQA